MESNISADFDLVCELSARKRYDYIIVGSGLGGGVLARQLVKLGQTVLLIEKGGLIFSTHCLNTSRPHWQTSNDEGPSQDNDIVYNTTKQKVQTAQGSDPYVGGPVYCLGGRSTVWGLFAPRIADETCKAYFSRHTYEYLTTCGYKQAFKLMTNGSQDIEDPNKIYPIEGDPTVGAAKRTLTNAIEGFYSKYGYGSTINVQLAPIAAEFNSTRLYQLPQGAYSTVDALLDLTYARDCNLTILLNTEVLNVSQVSGEWRSVTARTMSDQRVAEIRAVKGVILCAGTIGTATIMLNSEIQPGIPNMIGKGLTDHEIWGVRFVKETDRRQVPVKLQCDITVCNEPALLNVAVNANTFLGRDSAAFVPPTLFYDRQGNLMTGVKTGIFNPYGSVTLGGSDSNYDTINVTLEYSAKLSDESRVLNVASSDPCIYVRRPNPRESEDRQKEMQFLAFCIWDRFLRSSENTDLQAVEDVPTARLSLAGFGAVAHEVGTMRMAGPKSGNDWVVGTNYMVRDHASLFVCDLSIFPMSPPANPSLTLAAMALQLAAQLADSTAGTY